MPKLPVTLRAYIAGLIEARGRVVTSVLRFKKSNGRGRYEYRRLLVELPLHELELVTLVHDCIGGGGVEQPTGNRKFYRLRLLDTDAMKLLWLIEPYRRRRFPDEDAAVREFAERKEL